MSALPENALTLLEQRADAKRGWIYSVILWAVVIVALVAAFATWGSIAFEEGVLTGRAIEKKLVKDTAKPTTSCANLAEVCAAEHARRWRKSG
jgi:hypothetical protein